MKAPTKASTKARAFRTIDNAHRELRIAKQAQAKEAIGPIRPGQDVFILTFGQFSLIDVLVHPTATRRETRALTPKPILQEYRK